MRKDYDTDDKISIHTPKKGVTSHLLSCRKIYFQFQSTLPRREWPPKVQFLSMCDYFNPHSQEGSDGAPLRSMREQENFNPHSQEGSDEVVLNNDYSLKISIHTPKKGVTGIVISSTV